MVMDGYNKTTLVAAFGVVYMLLLDVHILEPDPQRPGRTKLAKDYKKHFLVLGGDQLSIAWSLKNLRSLQRLFLVLFRYQDIYILSFILQMRCSFFL